MPIGIDKFESEGKDKTREFVQENIMRILEANPGKAFSSAEFERALDKRRQSINQALRALESKGKIVRGLVPENKRTVCYAKLKIQEESNGIDVAEETQTVEKPTKRSSRKKGKKGKSKKRK